MFQGVLTFLTVWRLNTENRCSRMEFNLNFKKNFLKEKGMKKEC